MNTDGRPEAAASRNIPAADPAALREAVKEHYVRRLDQGSCCGPSGCGTEPHGEELPQVPSFGCGDSTSPARLQPGEHVLDLGSGAGFDAFHAARAVGPGGTVVGVDMTPAMLQRARAAAVELGLANVRFVEGTIEQLPVPDASVDVVISNCVVNLSADVPRVLAEAERVLEPDGRLRISDTFRLGAPPAQLDSDAWCACEGGAHDPAVLVRQAKAAGFADVALDPAPAGLAPGAVYGAVLSATKPNVVVLDRPDLGRRLLRDAGLPLDGWDAPGLARWAVLQDGRVAGVIALEIHGRHGLVRSLAVEPTARRRGLATALLAHVRRHAERYGLATLAGLTTTIPGAMRRWGFRDVTRAELPSELADSTELQGACPQVARAFLVEAREGRFALPAVVGSS